MIDLRSAERLLTEERNKKRNDRSIKTVGHEAGAAYTAVADTLVAQVIAALPDARERLMKAKGETRCLIGIVSEIGLSDETLAVCALQGLLHSIGEEELSGDTMRTMGQFLEYEAFGAGLTRHSPKLAEDVAERTAKTEFRTQDERRQYAVNRAAKGSKATAWQKAIDGYKQADWGGELRTLAGKWLLELVLNACPGMFVFDGSFDGKSSAERIVLAEEAEEIGRKAVAALMKRNHIFLPMLTPPTPWTAATGGGPKDGRIHTTKLLRLKSSHDTTLQMVEDACNDGQAQAALDGINALQGVPWRVNRRVLGVLRTLFGDEARVKGLPKDKLKKPVLPCPREELSEQEQWAYDAEKRTVKKWNRAQDNTARSIEADLSVADMFADADRFYVPYNMDWRGRAYGMSNLNFLREDRVRALFLFADGEPLGEDGFKWLCHHAAGCWANAVSETDKRKTDKIPTEERVEWVQANWDAIVECADFPLRSTWWQKADAPFLFLASIFELVAASRAENGPSAYVCALPVSFDGSCSGLQHYSAATHAPEGRFVNLTPSAAPMDIYAEVAALVIPYVQEIAGRKAFPEGKEWMGEVARLWLAYDKGITRSVVKRGVMTWPYSSKARGMGGQVQVDLMDVLKAEVLAGERSEHPFKGYEKGSQDKPGKAAQLMGQAIYDCIGTLIRLPAQAMKFLQEIARACAQEGKAAMWVSPVGIPWVNRYCEIETTRLRMWLSIAGVKTEVRATVATGEDEVAIRESKSENAIAPNFIHALDAAHLLRVAARCGREGIAIATVHDSFGCLPSRAGYFNRVIREEFISMYQEHDPLAEIRASAAEMLTDHSQLPELFPYGALDLSTLLTSEFCFA